MLRHKPSFTYCGLTVVLSHPSRFDKTALLSANGGMFFNNKCLRPDYNIHQCDVRLKEDRSELLPGTKCVLLLGEAASKLWLSNQTNTIGEIRGSPYLVNGVVHIATFFPQDAVDFKDYETANAENVDIPLEVKLDDDSLTEKRRHGKTSRANFGFFIYKDVQKCKVIMKNGGKIPDALFKPEYIIQPSSELLIHEFTTRKNQDFYIDFETDTVHNPLCLGFSFGVNNPIYTFPFRGYDYQWSYHNLPKIIWALAIAVRDNRVIAHNGAAFDFLVLLRKLRIAVHKVYDTMLAMHRVFTRIEKSLGHGMSLWTYEPFHKDEGGGGWNNSQQMRNMMLYCGKDVYGMILIHKAIEAYAKRVPGLQDSIDQVMSTIVPYDTMSMEGIRYNNEELKAVMHENDRLMMQYNRIIRLLIGDKTNKELEKRFKSSLASSNPQCVLYFHEMLGYPVVGKGKVKKDGTRGPSLAKDNLFKLKLSYNNPVIDLIIAYRETAKESGSLKFNHWKE